MAHSFRDYPDLEEITAAGFGLAQAFHIWNMFVNMPERSPADARAYLERRRNVRLSFLEAPHEPGDYPELGETSTVIYGPAETFQILHMLETARDSRPAV